MPGLSHALVPAQESKRWSFGHLLLLPVIQKGLFLGPKKARKIRHANTGLPSRWTPRNCRVLWVTLVIGRGRFLIRGGVIHCVSCTLGACKIHGPRINPAIQCVQEVRLQPMGIEVVDTRYYDKLPILYIHVKKDLVASMSMNKCWRPIIGCTDPER